MSACRRRGSTAPAAATPPPPTRAATAAATTTTNPTTSDDIPFNPDELHDLYTWVDGLPLSRPKRHIARDFADGCCVAELMHHFFPRLVELHNYTPAMGQRQKRDNWRALNTRVFRRLCFDVPSAEVDDIVAAVPGAIERFLRALRIKIAQIQACRRRGGNNNSSNNDDDDDDNGGGGGARVAGRIAMSRATASTDAAATRNDDNNSNDGNDANGNAHMTSARQRRVASRSLSPTARRGSAQTMTRTTAAPRHTDARDVHCSVRHRSLYDVVSPSQPRHVDAAASVAATDNNKKSNTAAADDDNDHDKDDDSALRAKQPTVRLLLAEKDRTIVELRETVGILSEKIAKLEELVRVKDDKLSQYRSKFGRM